MNKNDFTEKLRKKLSSLPEKERNESINFYSEMIDDLIEDGLTEEEALLKIGTPQEVAYEIIKNIPLSKIINQKIKPLKPKSTQGVLLIALGSPLWLPLLIVGVAVVFSLYASLWVVVISFYAVFLTFALCSPASTVLGIIYIFNGSPIAGLSVISASFIVAGLAIFTFYLCKYLTICNVKIAKTIILAIKKSFIEKEDA